MLETFVLDFLGKNGHPENSLLGLPLSTLKAPYERIRRSVRRFSVDKNLEFAYVSKVCFRRLHFASVKSSYFGVHNPVECRDF